MTHDALFGELRSILQRPASAERLRRLDLRINPGTRLEDV
jgi:hypothetical protein